MKWRLSLTIALCAASLAAPVAAQPSIWDRAREPYATEEYRSLLAIERFLLGETKPWQLRHVEELLIDYLDGRRFADPALELVLAQLRLETAPHAEPSVRQRLREVLEANPDLPMAAHGWLGWGNAAAVAGEVSEARYGYQRALERAWERELRVRIFHGRAQLRLFEGDVDGAIIEYRRALSSARRPADLALAHWALGVCLERNGDFLRGLEEVSVGARINPRSTAFATRSVLDLPGIFFLPSYDIDYYRGLAKMAVGRKAASATQSKAAYESALVFWNDYIRQAERALRKNGTPRSFEYAPVRWLARARRHQRASLEKIQQLEAESIAEARGEGEAHQGVH